MMVDKVWHLLSASMSMYKISIILFHPYYQILQTIISSLSLSFQVSPPVLNILLFMLGNLDEWKVFPEPTGYDTNFQAIFYLWI